MNVIENDYKDVTRLDEHFAARREQEMKLEADAQKAQHEAAMIPLHGERIRKMGLAALAAGAGVGLALFGASFLIAPNTRVVTVTKEVPGPERVVTVTKEVPGPERVVTVTKEVPGPERVVTVTKEVPGPERVVIRPGPIHEHVVTKDVPGRVATPPSPPSVQVKEDCPTGYSCDYPEGIPHKLVENPSSPPSDAPVTPEEKKFTERPEYKDAVYRGRIVKSRDGRALSFEDGKDFSPGHWDDATGKMMDDPNDVNDSDPYVGDLGMCSPKKDRPEIWLCVALHNGQEVHITHQPIDKSADAAPWHDYQVDPAPAQPQSVCIGKYCTSSTGPQVPTPVVSAPTERPCSSGSCAPQPPGKSAGVAPAMDMVNVSVDVAGYRVKAMVDTGCSFPMAIPTALAAALLHDGRAIFAGETKSLLADGKEVDVGIILIKSITVDGRTLDSVEASVSPSNSAPILLGLSALNRLGPFTIDNGRIVFTGNQPT